MPGLHQRIEQMWWSDRQPPLLLKAASSVYDAVNRRNLNKRKSNAISPALPMISVGNVTAGGSGKTPFVIWLAILLKNEGMQPVILCRGDGGSGGDPELVTESSDPQKVGDEALLLHQKSGCPVLSGHDRVRTADMAQNYGNIIILDDGFQYLQLRRVCDIVLIPAEGVGNGHLIPAGPLREAINALDRADLIVRTGRANSPEPLTHGKEWQWWCREDELKQVAGLQSEKPEKAVALTAIARPSRFLQSLENTGIDIIENYTFPDHHSFSASEIQQVTQHGEAVVVTSKDAVKLQPVWPVGKELWVLDQSPEAEENLFTTINGFIR